MFRYAGKEILDEILISVNPLVVIGYGKLEKNLFFFKVRQCRAKTLIVINNDRKEAPMRTVYPWQEWFDRKRLTLRRGREYRGRTYVFAQQVRNAAVRHGVNVHIKIAVDEQSLTVTVVEDAGCPS